MDLKKEGCDEYEIYISFTFEWGNDNRDILLLKMVMDTREVTKEYFEDLTEKQKGGDTRGQVDFGNLIIAFHNPIKSRM